MLSLLSLPGTLLRIFCLETVVTFSMESEREEKTKGIGGAPKGPILEA